MVKYFGTLFAAFAVLALAAPAFAQDAPQFEITMGYANLDLANDRHSGFASNQAINLNHWFGIENYFGYYKLPTDPSFGKSYLLSIVPGAKVTYRAEKVEPYAAVGLGGSSLQFPQSGLGTGTSFTFRLGGGIDIPFKESFAIRFDVSRLSLRSGGAWNSGTNISTGLVIRIFE